MKDNFRKEDAREMEFLNNNEDMFGIYQLKQTEETHSLIFMPMSALYKEGKMIKKDNYELKYVAALDEKMSLDDIFEKFNIAKPDDFYGRSLSVSDVVVMKRKGEARAYYVDSYGFEKITSLFIGSDQSAYSIADRFISIQECDEGYDYSIYDDEYKLLDGGVYDDPDVLMQDVLSEIIEDILKNEKLRGKVEKGSFASEIDYDELMENVEKTEMNIFQPRFVEYFKRKTDLFFHPINGMNHRFIEANVRSYLQSKIDDYGLDVKIVDLALYGSRSRGIEKQDSDIDFVVEYKGTVCESHLFNIFHEDGFSIGGKTVDVNPITEWKTGTIDEYLKRAEEEFINSKIITSKSIVAELKSRGYNAQVKEVVKNGTVHEAIVIRGNEKISPVIYTENLIAEATMNGKSIGEVTDSVINIYRNQDILGFDVKNLQNREFVLSHLYIGLQKKSTEDIEKSNCGFEGIESYLYIRLCTENDKIYSVKVRKETLEHSCITLEEAWKNARINTNSETVVLRMDDAVGRPSGGECIPEDDDSAFMYIVTNKKELHGASAILNDEALVKLSEKLGTRKFIVLPSSVHEMLVMPFKEDIDIEALNLMVALINRTERRPEERLTDRVYVIEL